MKPITSGITAESHAEPP